MPLSLTSGITGPYTSRTRQRPRRARHWAGLMAATLISSAALFFLSGCTTAGATRESATPESLKLEYPA